MEFAEHEEQKLDLIALLGDFTKIARRYLLLLLALVIVGGAVFGIRAYRAYVPQYTASATVSVRVASPLYGGTSAYNTATAEQMAKTFPYVLTSGVLQERVKNYLGIAYMPSVKVTSSTSGSLIFIDVTDLDPERAWEVLKAVMIYYPEIAEYVVGPTKLVVLHESGVPTAPINVRNIKNPAIKGAILGAGLWAVMILVLALMVNTVHSEKELKAMINIPCVGQIPHIRRSDRKGNSLLYKSIQSASFSEAVRMLRVRVEKAMEEKEHKVLLISSAIPGEGKTTISSNIALSLAHKGKKVLIIDADLRNPSVAKTLGMNDLPMIGEYLEGKLAMDTVICKTEHKNLSVVAGGVGQSATIKSVRMSRLAELIRHAREQYDTVILDTPPCSLLADASEYADMADCGLMVVRQEYASREQILDGIQRLSDGNLPLLGCAMNHARGRSGGYGYGYGYGKGYGKSYGYGEKKK